ncbi:MAG: ABC transporter permease [Chitinophagaceae bacterium]|nr:ABC transporter permease [Chitinophagaceae bacterium]
MLKNYFKIAVRHLTKHKMFSIINILCLAIGITFAMLIGEYIIHEKRVNADLLNVNQQYIIKSKWKEKGMGLDFTTLGPLAQTLKTEYPTLVANYYRYNPVLNVVSAGDKHFKEDIAIGDTTLISMYGFPLLYGNPQQPFANNNSAVITETLALKLYGDKNAIGKTLDIQTVRDDKQLYTVSAVLKDIPYNSIMNLLGDTYSVFVPTVGNRYYPGTDDPAANWAGIFEIAAIELRKGISPESLQKPVKQLLTKYASKDICDNLTVELAPMKTYYTSNNNGAVQKMITTLLLVVIFIITMAVINFININIGTSSYRLKEMGLRKVFGGAKRQLIFQYLTESLLLTFIAGVLSLGLYELMRSYFSGMLNTPLSPLWKFDFFRISSLTGFVVLVGLIAGIYPAFIMSASNTVHAIKGKIDTAKGGLVLRRLLLIVQFTLAIVVFISALNVSRQVTYFFNKDLGYNKEQLMVVTAFPKKWDSTGVAKMETIKKGLLTIPAIKNASLSFEIPDRKPPNSIGMLPVGAAGNQPVLIATMGADEDYAETLGLKVKAGNFFNHGKGVHIPSQIVLNESAVKSLGLTLENATGKQLTIPSFNNAVFTIAGVVNDFNYSTLHEKIEPLSFLHTEDLLSYRFLTLKLNTSDMAGTISAIKKQWNALSPGNPFEYFFMDEKFQKLYQSELQLKKATETATVLNLIIVFMGIFGVVAFTLVKRNKEIAVRKVLGADINRILFLFIKDYTWLIIIANIIAWPIAYLANNYWLQNFEYRMPPQLLPYLMVSGFILLATIIFIVLQCYKIAVSNPVKVLRTE